MKFIKKFLGPILIVAILPLMFIARVVIPKTEDDYFWLFFVFLVIFPIIGYCLVDMAATFSERLNKEPRTPFYHYLSYLSVGAILILHAFIVLGMMN